MFSKLKSRLYGYYKKIVTGIAFLPTVISILLFMLAIALIMFHSSDREHVLLDAIPFIEIKNADTARSLLASILTGIISLTIFSFSMVMLVLNQAAQRFTPKVIDGLISNRSNQFVLGVYVGTIVYTIILLMQIRQDDYFDKVPHLGVAVAIILALLCISLFVKFISDISRSVQVSNITERLYRDTLAQLKAEKKLVTTTNQEVPYSGHWYTYGAKRSGYIQDISVEILLGFAVKHDIIIKTVQQIGLYYTQDTPLVHISKELKDEEIEIMTSAFIFYGGEDIADNAFYGLRQLKEIAAKALSPGVNEPGTALTCLDYLTDLLAYKMGCNYDRVVQDKAYMNRIFIKCFSFEEVLNRCISPIRIYGKGDTNIVHKLLDMFHNLSFHDRDFKYQQLLNEHAGAVIEDASADITNSLDRRGMNKEISSLNQRRNQYFSLPLLAVSQP